MSEVCVSRERPVNRRRSPRVRLGVPVRLSYGAGSGGAVPAGTGESADVGLGGVYLTTEEQGPFVPGELLTISIMIPWELRGLFPFSRILGRSRIVRVERAATSQSQRTGLALAFCDDQVTMLGAIVAPPMA